MSVTIISNTTINVYATRVCIVNRFDIEASIDPSHDAADLLQIPESCVKRTYLVATCVALKCAAIS